MDDKDPFGYPLSHYVWVVIVASVGGLVKYLNSMQKFSAGRAAVELITAGFTGLMTFWICKWMNIEGALQPVMVAVSGFMGVRAWQEFENFWRVRFGMPGGSYDSAAMQQMQQARLQGNAGSQGANDMNTNNTPVQGTDVPAATNANANSNTSPAKEN